MKLAALGVVTVALGIGLGEPGLWGIGAFWIAVGPLMRLHGQRLKEQAGSDGKPSMDTKTFATGTALWLLLGVPSVLVGLLRLGIGVDHQDWRWLPLVLGGLAVGIGVISAVLFVLGGAALAAAERGPARTVPATLWISRVRETGTYVNERPRLEFVFRVEPDAETGVAPYAVTKKATVPATAMGSLGVGDGFRAHVAGPEHPTAMDIAWDEPVKAPGAVMEDVSARLGALDQLHREGKISDTEHQAQRERILGAI